MRAFVAWNPWPAEADALERLRDGLRLERDDPGYRWMRRDQLHVTLRFLGDVEDAQRPRVDAALRELAADFAPFEATVAGWQYWPDRRSPRVLVLRLESRGAFERLGLAAEAAMRSCGFPAERRPFRAHLTLARSERLASIPEQFAAPPPPITLAIDHATLMRSDLCPDGARYTELSRHPLAGT